MLMNLCVEYHWERIVHIRGKKMPKLEIFFWKEIKKMKDGYAAKLYP